jgi:tRNA (cmo5U34)-methyltransferase
MNHENAFERHNFGSVEQYAKRANQSVPGRDTFFHLTRFLLNARAPRTRRILIVGSGGGEEILQLSERHGSYSFVEVDLSEQMLELARTRIAEAQLPCSVELYRTPIQELDVGKFDAATCIQTAVSETREIELLEEARFEQASCYWQAFCFRGFVAINPVNLENDEL